MDNSQFFSIYEQLPNLGIQETKKIEQLRNEFIQETEFESELSLFLQDKEQILDLCCGKPTKIRSLVEKYPHCQFNGMDINPNISRYYCGENISFIQADIMQPLKINADGIISFHGCGDLSDRIVELASENSIPVLFMPCCYAKINGTITRPLSQYFSQEPMKSAYFSLLRTSRRLESNQDGQTSKADITRALFNYDRIQKLQESGQQARLVRFNGANRPHNLGVISQ